MNKKLKKGLIIAGITVDVGLTIFLFVVSIVMLATLPPNAELIDTTTFIGYLQGNPTFYLCMFVVPLFVLLIANIVFLAMYVKKVSKKAVVLEDLSDEQKEAIRKELLKDMQEPSSEKKE